MSRLLCALSMVAVVTHTPYIAIASGEGDNSTSLCMEILHTECAIRMSILMIAVIHTTDARPIALSGSHVVPVAGSVTCTCSSSPGGGQLVWTVNTLMHYNI